MQPLPSSRSGRMRPPELSEEQQDVHVAHLRKALQVAIDRGNEAAAARLRLVLAQRGERCSGCRLAGFCRDNCPRCATTRQSEAEQRVVDEIGGYYWGADNPRTASNVYEEFDAAKRSQEYTFFAEKRGWFERPTAAETLRAVMHKVATVLEKELKECMDTTDTQTRLFVPPKEKPREQYYPDSVFAEDKHYFAQEKSKKRQRNQAYRYNGYIRPADQLDGLFRGAVKSLKEYYEIPKNAGASIHGYVGWKSVTATNDMHAISDLNQAREMEELEKLFQNQSQWVQLRQGASENRQKRCMHLLSLLRSETVKEHEREHELLSLEGNQLRKRQADIAKARMESADRMMRILVGYGLISGAAEADYLQLATEFETEGSELQGQPQPWSVKLKKQGTSSTFSLPSAKLKKELSQSTMLTNGSSTALTASTNMSTRRTRRRAQKSNGASREPARLWNRLTEEQLDKRPHLHANKSYSSLTHQQMRIFQATTCGRPNGQCVCPSVLARSYCSFKHQSSVPQR